jgi:hypothetical protein
VILSQWFRGSVLSIDRILFCCYSSSPRRDHGQSKSRILRSEQSFYAFVMLRSITERDVLSGSANGDRDSVSDDVCGPCASSSRQLPAACHIFHHLTSGFANVRILFSRTRSQWSAILIFTNIDANKALSVAVAGNTPRPRTWLIPNSSKPGRKGDRAAVRNAILHRFAQIELCLKL